MYVARTVRMSAAAVAAVLAVGTFGATAAQAKPTKPGAVTGLAASVTPHTASYTVHASWNSVARATGYRASILRSGTTLASNTKLTDTSWNPTVTTGPGDVTLSVTAVVGHRKSRATTLVVHLPDVTAPTGSFTSDWSDSTGAATITQETLADDSGTGGITRTVDWKDGTAPELWNPGNTTINHSYPLTEKRYVPTVTLNDAADNQAVVDVPAIVINDDEAPTGTYANQTATAWAAFTKVYVSQSDIDDNWTPNALIARSVDWGDGTTTDWTSGTTVLHVYATAGSYTPAVTITDEAHNLATVQTSAVVVKADTLGPKVRLTLPKAKHSVKAWKTLRGKAIDRQTGVKSVWLKAVEKRGGSWFAYKAPTHTWVKAGSKAKAFSRARAFTLTTHAHHRWTAKVAKLRKGTLVYKVRATDHVHNRSATVTHKASLTKA